MAKKTATKKPTPKPGGAGNKAKAAAKPNAKKKAGAKPTAKKPPIKKPPFTKKIGDLNLED
jgi:hypothetical protein